MKHAERVGCLVYHSFLTPQELAARKPSPPGWAAPSKDDFARHMSILAEMGGSAITYGQFSQWHSGQIELPAGSVLIDFDNVNYSQYRDAYPVLASHGWVGNLMINTAAPIRDGTQEEASPDRGTMTWDEIRELKQAGWGICSHTHRHRQMSVLADEDPTGASIEREMMDSIHMLENELGVTPRHFAYVGRGWNELAESIVKRHFVAARLWVANMTYFLGGGREMRVGEIMGAGSRLEPDGGPLIASRYLTRDSDPYRIPGVDACNLPFTTESMRAFIAGLL